MKRLFISMILTAVAFGQDVKFIAAPSSLPTPILEFGSSYHYCLESSKCIMLDKDGVVVKDDGLTRDELIQLMHKVTLGMVESQKYSSENYDAQIDRYKKMVELLERKSDLLEKAYTELLDGLKEVQKALQPPPAKPNKAKGKA